MGFTRDFSFLFSYTPLYNDPKPLRRNSEISVLVFDACLTSPSPTVLVQSPSTHNTHRPKTKNTTPDVRQKFAKDQWYTIANAFDLIESQTTMYLVPSHDVLGSFRRRHTGDDGANGAVRLFHRYAIPTGKYINTCTEDVVGKYDIVIRDTSGQI